MSITVTKIIKRLLLFVIVALATIIFSLEVQRFIPYLLAAESVSNLHTVPGEKSFTIENQDVYKPPKKKKNLKSMIKKTLGLPEEYLYEQIDLVLADEQTISLDIQLYIKSEKTLGVFTPLARKIREEMEEYIESLEEVDFTNPVGLARVRKNLIRLANVHFDQIVVTKLVFKRMDIGGQDS